MDTYILRKDYLVCLLVGKNYTIPEKSGLYLDNPLVYKVKGYDYLFSREFVEYNSEWFEKKESPSCKVHVDDYIKGKILSSPEWWEGVEEYYKMRYAKHEDELIIYEKPRLSIRSEHIWMEERVRLLQDAIQRSGFKNCERWIEEWNRHVNWLMNRKKENDVSIRKDS